MSFLGSIEHSSDDLPQIYQVASIFNIASPIETQSIVTLEAMASGLPIVAANAGALPELVKNGKNGFLFKPKDSEDMSEKIIKILTDKKLAETMKNNSLEYVTKHTILTSFEEIESKYAKISKNYNK